MRQAAMAFLSGAKTEWESVRWLPKANRKGRDSRVEFLYPHHVQNRRSHPHGSQVSPPLLDGLSL